uniref:Zinc finger protein 407 n=5 Tax=Nothobranchius rachovii TaxID=451742 RepID=A0A1A8QB91_9TELE
MWYPSVIARHEMDTSLTLGEEVAGDRKPESDAAKVKRDDVELVESTENPQCAADEEHTKKPSSDITPEEEDNRCTVCGFSAKYPRSLKIHYTRKHSRDFDKTPKSPEQNLNIHDGKPNESQQEDMMMAEKAAGSKQKRQDLDELKLASSEDESTSLTTRQMVGEKQERVQEDSVTVPKRRVSKRIPKPKIIYSCNCCGQEFRDKHPLDVHIQRYHSKYVPVTLDADENTSGSEDAEDCSNTVKALPIQVAPKRPLSRFQKKCANCDFRASSTEVLEKHARVKHPDSEWYRCKVCKFLASTSELMNTHLSSAGHLQQQTDNSKSEVLSFEVCVESISRNCVGEDPPVGDVEMLDGQEITTVTVGEQEAEETSEAVKTEEDVEFEPPRKKRGRPKLGGSATCGYCGVVVSSATNLRVHVQRKHSKEYGYSCTLCNYNCVTKGDMDRHSLTKKHLKRAQESSRKSSDTGTSSQEPTSTPNTVPLVSETLQKADVIVVQEYNVEERTRSETHQQRSKDDSVNACSLCDFVAQSIPSLHLHVKRKHTKDFEYVCLACGYYSVTNREMHRHASTEKHKQRSQRYLELQESKEQKSSQFPSNEKQNNDPPVESANPDCEHPNPTDESGSCSIDNPVIETQSTSASPVSTEPVSAVVGAAGSADEKQVKTITSSSGTEPDPTSQTTELTVMSEPQQASGDVQLALHASAQQETQEERPQQAGDELVKADVMIADTQMSKAPPFDACIISAKALAEQEQVLHESLALEGEASVICLTGGLSSCLPSTISPYVKKVKPKEVKEREHAKGSSSNIRCEDCGFMADGVSGLNVHISMKHPTKDRHFHCLLCGKSFYTESNLHQHLTSAAHLRNEQNSVEELPEGGANFRCVKCRDRFETEQGLFFHIKEKHEELLKEVDTYVLEDTEQINREREENQGGVCKYCGKVCRSSNSMAFLAHIRTHTGSKPFTCTICSFSTAQLGDVRNHVKRHLGMREYKCDICGWAFVMKKHLNTHLLGKHGVGQRKERKFECELCDRSFSEKWALNNHMKLHNGEKPYKCVWPSCHYAFINLSAMKDHYRTHTGEKSYLCDLCGFAGGTRHALTKHRRQHTGERPFKCKICNFASTTQSHLSRHKRVHTGEKPYRCPWCDYRSNCAENIRKHILHTGKHEGVKMYNCPKCVYATNAPMDFRNHLKESHLDIENPDLAYLHAGIVSKSFECRLRGQGAAFVASDSDSSLQRKGSDEASGHDESIQQVIIIQGYGENDITIDQALEESAAATLQTLAMSGQVAEVLHITEDGQVIASGREVASAGAHLVESSTQYVVLDSGDTSKELQAVAGEEVEDTGATAGQSHSVSESTTALDALLSAVSEMGHQEKIQDQAAVVHEVLSPEMAEAADTAMEVKQEQEEVIQESRHGNMQEVLQLAASQMIKDGLTQVIVNDEGTHYIVTELDDCTLQVEGGVYGEAGAGHREGQPEEHQAEEEMVVYVDGGSHSIVLEE